MAIGITVRVDNLFSEVFSAFDALGLSVGRWVGRDGDTGQPVRPC
jgi:hypothetical protein